MVKRRQDAQYLPDALMRRSHDRTGHNNTRQRSGLVAEGCDLSDLPAFIGQTAGVPSRIWKPAVTAIVSPARPLRPVAGVPNHAEIDPALRQHSIK